MGRSATRKKRARRRAGNAHAWIVSSALFIFAGLLYVNTLGHGFVFDDVTLILQNPRVTHLQWNEILSLGSYRPVRTLTYAANFWLGGRDAFGFHLLNLLLHAGNTVLVFWFFRRLRGSRIWASLGALIFAAHPVQTAAVAYISGRKDILAAGFILAGLLAYLKFQEGKRSRYLLLVLLFFLLGVLSKEVALVFPVLLLLTDFCRDSGPVQPWRLMLTSLRRFWWLYLATVGLAALGLYYSVEVLRASRMEGVWGGSWITNWGTSFKLFQHYLELVLFPYPLLADYQGDVFAFSKGVSDPSTLLAVAITLAFAFLAVWAYRRNSSVTFGMLWFQVSLLPVLQLIPFHEPAADHFLYLPMIGPAFLAGYVGDRLLAGTPRKGWVWAGLASLIAVYSGLAVDRNRDWKDNQSLWSATYRAAPGSYRANCNLGGLAQQQGDLERALRLTKRCIELDPSKSLPYSNLGGIYRDLGSRAREAGRLESAKDLLHKAVDYTQEAVSLDPGNPWARSNMADAFKELALISESQGEGLRRIAQLRLRSAQEFERAVSRAAGHDAQAVIIYKLGAVYLDARNYQEALKYFLQCVDKLKQWAQPQAATGYAYLKLGKYQESVHYFQRALALEVSLDACLGLAQALEAVGDSESAVAVLERALTSFPTNGDVLYELGRLHAAAGDRKRARDYLLRALQLSRRRELSRAVQGLLDQIGGG